MRRLSSVISRSTRSASPDVSGHGLRRGGFVAAAVMALLLLVGAPAAAHDVLLSSDPEDGDSFDVAPAELTLTFNNNPAEIGAEIVVLDADGTDYASGDPVFDGPTVRQAIDPDAPAGEYHVQWRVVSSDGHAISDELRFTIRTGPEPAEEPEATEPGAEPDTTEPGAEPDDTEQPGADDSQTPEATADATADVAEDDGGFPWLAVGLTVAALAALATVIAVVVRRSRS